MKILVLAGGYDQISLIEELKKRKHSVILADYFENPPAKKVVDRYFQVSTLDKAAILQLAEKEKVDLITTACTDQALPTVAAVSEQLKLPSYLSYKKALQVTNKRYMKEMLVNNNIPTAAFKVISNLSELSSYEKKLNYPQVVKPCDCNSSKGVTKVHNTQELRKAVENAYTLSRSHQVVIEQFLFGQEVSIDVWVDKQRAKVLSVSKTEKIRGRLDAFIIYQSRYPVPITQNVKDRITAIANKIAISFGLEHCPILIQAMVYGDDVNVLEFSARMGGGTKHKLIRYMSGIDIMTIYVNRILGDKTQVINPRPSEKAMELNYVYTYGGTFAALKNFEECKRNGEIIDYYTYKEPLTAVKKAESSSDRVVGFLLMGKNREEIDKKRFSVLKQVDVLDIDGNSIMMNSIYGGNGQ